MCWLGVADCEDLRITRAASKSHDSGARCVDCHVSWVDRRLRAPRATSAPQSLPTVRPQIGWDSLRQRVVRAHHAPQTGTKGLKYFQLAKDGLGYVLREPRALPYSRSLNEILGCEIGGPGGRRLNETGHTVCGCI